MPVRTERGARRWSFARGLVQLWEEGRPDGQTDGAVRRPVGPSTGSTWTGPHGATLARTRQWRQPLQLCAGAGAGRAGAGLWGSGGGGAGPEHLAGGFTTTSGDGLETVKLEEHLWRYSPEKTTGKK
jgi:hypothetical protein